jgi:hypothetical protein
MSISVGAHVIRGMQKRAVNTVKNVPSQVRLQRAVKFSKELLSPRSAEVLDELRVRAKTFFLENESSMSNTEVNVFPLELFRSERVQDMLKGRPEVENPSFRDAAMPLAESCVATLKEVDPSVHDNAKLNGKSFLVLYHPKENVIEVPVHSDAMTYTFLFPLFSGERVEADLKVYHPEKSVASFGDGQCVVLVNDHPSASRVRGVVVPPSKGVYHSVDVSLKPGVDPRDKDLFSSVRGVLVLGFTVVR